MQGCQGLWATSSSRKRKQAKKIKIAINRKEEEEIQNEKKRQKKVYVYSNMLKIIKNAFTLSPRLHIFLRFFQECNF
jgi:hypothetical protein